MFGKRKPPGPKEFSGTDGTVLARAYLDDPSDIACPHCGRGTIEVVCFLDAASVEFGDALPTSPEGHYMVILYCHGCTRAGAVDLSEAGTEA